MLYISALVTGDPAQPPSDDSVIAGPVAFAIFAVLILAIAFLGWSMVRQFKKVDAAAEKGLYDPTTRADKHVTIPVDDGRDDQPQA